MSNIVTFPHVVARAKVRAEYRSRTGDGKNMHTYLFRSREAILEAAEADLLSDVRLDIDKAAKKVEAIRRRLRGIKEQAAAQIEMLTAAELKLNAALVIAVLERA
jgi:Mg2+ and Co2+ transporter CorA